MPFEGGQQGRVSHAEGNYFPHPGTDEQDSLALTKDPPILGVWEQNAK